MTDIHHLHMDAFYRLRHIALFLVLSAIDIAFGAAAGAAAVAMGAHVEGVSVTGHALGIGTVAATTKSGLLAFVGFLGLAHNMNIAARMLLIIATSVFGISIIITTQVCNAVLGQTPSELLIAAVVAAIPLQWEEMGMYIGSKAYREKDSSTGEQKTRFVPGSVLTSWLALVGFDALGGYTFARVAQNQGMHICGLGSAAASGAVYGMLSGIPRMLSYLAWGVVHQ
ncbi:hypothetical protein NKR23_g8207 [Pleurostoma richardsiae]|uniref:Uncharacterized protein n=1 Tax=Pleurostoma richardsiae TaxID=41990 RepID=A0AA38R9U3_9PEZI|nr:hypothetical protein NKR23_g8207 [Pleurostoma richardsiae]